MMKQKKPNTPLFLTGAVCLIYGLFILFTLSFRYVFNYFYFCLGILLLSLSFLWDRTKKGFRTFFLISTVLFLALFVFVEGNIISHSRKDTLPDADYVILLGAGVDKKGPSVDYRARLDSTLEYLEDNPDTIVICTGAQGPREPVSEAKAGKDYLVKRGVEEKRILLEDQSINTAGNITNAKALLIDNGADPEETPVVIVSADYHLYRASFIAEKLGFGRVSCKGGHGLAVLLPQCYTREFFAYLKDFLVFSLRS
ncbi:MAG: YdcF family protein [Erysipelotrichaceae bacterium]|nr:YdcF family protein [Erysipelotrichaceae bacterium]